MRIIVLPFVLATILISFNYQAIIRCINFVKYGGELVEWIESEKTKRWNESNEFPDCEDILSKAKELQSK